MCIIQVCGAYDYSININFVWGFNGKIYASVRWYCYWSNYMQFGSPWDQPTLLLTILRSSSLTLERVLMVVSLLSPVTLSTLAAVEVLLRTMVREDWDSGRILMGV